VGFEGALLFIAFGSLLPSPALSVGLWGATMGGMLYALYRHFLEGKDLPIFAVLSCVAVLVIPFLRDIGRVEVIILAVLAAAGVVAITAFFRLVYKLISTVL
jgi:serine/threonine-protein kinase